MKACGKCGKKYPDEYMFCMECGSELGKGIVKPEWETRAPGRGKGEAKTGKDKAVATYKDFER
jgi:uncharacterized OB-fold protein